MEHSKLASLSSGRTLHGEGNDSMFGIVHVPAPPRPDPAVLFDCLRKRSYCVRRPDNHKQAKLT